MKKCVSPNSIRSSFGSDLRGAKDDEERVAVHLDLGPLVGAVSVLDRQVVEAELRLHPAQQLLARLVEPDPDEAIGLLEDLADLLDVDALVPLAIGIGHAIDDAHDQASPGAIRAYSAPTPR